MKDTTELEAIRPHRRQDVEAHEVLDEMVLYDPVRNRAVSLNRSARAIWRLCDGRRTPMEICASLRERFGGAEERMLADVKAAIGQLHELGLLNQDPSKR